MGASVRCGAAESSRRTRGRGKHKPNWGSNRYSSRLHRKPGCLPRRRSRLEPPFRLRIRDQSPHLAPCPYLTENLGVFAISGMRGGTLPVYENSTTSNGSDEHRRLQAAMATQSLMSCPRLSEQDDGRLADGSMRSSSDRPATTTRPALPSWHTRFCKSASRCPRLVAKDGMSRFPSHILSRPRRVSIWMPGTVTATSGSYDRSRA
jgi:hypothetical protein